MPLTWSASLPKENVKNDDERVFVRDARFHRVSGYVPVTRNALIQVHQMTTGNKLPRPLDFKVLRGRFGGRELEGA